MAPRARMISEEKEAALRIQQQRFEQQLFPGALWKEKEQLHLQPKRDAIKGRGELEQQTRFNLEQQVKAYRDQNENQNIYAASSSHINSSVEGSTTKRKKTRNEDKTPFLYDNKQSHPIIEYKPSREEIDSGSITPSFVLEVTWPRIVEFYHPSSPHCISFQSSYVALARGIKRRSSRLPVEFHALNCGRYREVCDFFHVKTVPLMIGLKSGMIEGTEITLSDDLGDEELVQYVANVLGVSLDVVGGNAADAYAKPVESDTSNQIHSQERDGATTADSVNFLNRAKGYHEEATISKETSFVQLSEQVFHDAMSSFVVTLTSSLYSHLPHGSALPPDRSMALREFIDLIRWAFPPETQVHELAQKLADEFFAISISEAGLLKSVREHTNIDEVMTWSPRCSRSIPDNFQDGYACGLWSLLHILSLGVAERHSAVVGDVDRLSPSYAGHVIRSFIDIFFIHCETCRKLWVTLYDEACCELHNADHSTANKVKEDASNDETDWRQLAFWIWEIHNEISVQAKHSAGKGYYNKYSHTASSDLLWPSLHDCPTCWQTTNSGNGQLADMNLYDRDAVYGILKDTYWIKGVHNNRHILLDKWTKTKRSLSLQHLRDRMDSHRGLTLNAFLLMACLFWLLYARYRDQTRRLCYLFGYQGHRRKKRMQALHHHDRNIIGHKNVKYNYVHESSPKLSYRRIKQSKESRKHRSSLELQHTIKRSNGRNDGDQGYGLHHYQL
ncbi:hypothetical protein HJC23_002007 [Cyclotella cryptica]|uniref:Sulfhydryl oxidase n=1 Tax=Cyclotella cryptica TaxID=29204 RepID=A0ABD3NFF9_9STRA|eukprot:CCRYP_021103-RA/>CCRYP_021103-RA protein AED:0.41 eAED:0.41 QI:0/-1/0/1/-1/1/1/0/729